MKQTSNYPMPQIRTNQLITAKFNKGKENYPIPPEFAPLFCAISFCRASDVDSEAWRLERESNSLVR